MKNTKFDIMKKILLITTVAILFSSITLADTPVPGHVAHEIGGGTFNYINGDFIFPYGTSVTMKDDATISGNLGIGIENPSSKLEVDGNTNIKGNVEVKGTTSKNIAKKGSPTYHNAEYSKIEEEVWVYKNANAEYCTHKGRDEDGKFIEKKGATCFWHGDHCEVDECNTASLYPPDQSCNNYADTNKIIKYEQYSGYSANLCEQYDKKSECESAVVGIQRYKSTHTYCKGWKVTS